MSSLTNAKARPLAAAGRQTWALLGLVMGACFLGIAVVVAGGGSGVQTVAIGAFSLFVLGALISVVLDLPMIVFVRLGFVASFFFKGDVSLFKTDEIEDPSGLNLSLTLVAGLILVTYDYFSDEEKERPLTRGFSLLLTALFVCATLSVLYAGPTLLGGFSVLSFLTSVLITYATASHFYKRDRLIQLVIFLAIGVLFTGIIAFTQYTFAFPMDMAWLGTGSEAEQLGTQSIVFSRVPAFFRTPNAMGWVLSSLVPVIIAPIICRVKSFTSFQRSVLFAAAFSGVVGIILSLARGSWIGLIAAVGLVVLVGWYRLSQRERKTYFVAVGGTLILTCVLLTPFAGRIYDRMTADDQGAAMVRIPLMETALLMIEDNPLVGVGLSEYRTAMIRYDETGIFVSQVFPNPVHNIFAHITAEVGIPGGILFSLLFVFAFIECFKAMSMHDRLLFALGLGTSVALVAFILSGMKEPGALGSVRPPIRTCFLLFGTIMAFSRMRRIALRHSEALS